MNQVLPVVRLQLVHWRYGLGMPVGILALVFALNLALFGSMGEVIPPSGRMTGGILSIYIVFGVGLLQTMTQTFTFALGMSVTRRAFQAGVVVLNVVEAIGFGTLLLVLTVPFLAFAAVGMFFGVIFKRWGQPGVYVVTVATSVVLAALTLLITWRSWWPQVGSWFAGQSTAALFAGYPLVLVLLLGAASWLAIRRATP